MPTLQKIDPANLLLDTENPRFGLSAAEDQAEAIEILARKADLKELWDSILLKGFEAFEPLVAFRDGNNYIVVEGNRRLAAVKSLLEPDRLSNVRVTVPSPLPTDVAKTLYRLPVNVVEHRDEADDYIGFKHINGPASWDALAKARFAVKLFEKMEVEAEDNRVEILGKRLGDGRQLILRSLVAFKIIEQAIENGMLEEKDINSNSLDFSHLYTMLPNRDARAYLGLGTDPLNEQSVKDNPVPDANLKNLAYMISWLFGDPNNSPIIRRQGTDRPRLQKVLADDDAISTLEQTRDFDRAVEEAGFYTESWLNDTVKLATLSKKVSDGVTDLPENMEEDDIEKAVNRLNSSARNVKSAIASVETLFANDD